MPTISRAKRSAAGAYSAAGASFSSAARMTAPRRHAITWHDGRSSEPHPAHDHAWHDGLSARRAFVPPQHNGPRHDAHRHHGRSIPRTTHLTRSGLSTTQPQRPNGLAFSCRERAGRSLQNATDLAREAVNCNLSSRWAVTSHQRNPLAARAHPLVSYHSDQQLRPPRQLEPASPYCNLVPTHPRLAHWWQLVFHRPTDPDHQTVALRCGGWSSSAHSIE
jgi:hypothetical protein